MARIRSVHPALFTDEAWVSCSPLARLLIIGLWTDADDQGVFEWKPLQIKMRLLPGDMAEVVPLLSELTVSGLIMRFDVAGKAYGAIRNFRRFQRPKKPNAIHPMTAEVRQYVCLDHAGSETDDVEADPVRNQFGTDGEIRPQMEDGGGRREEILGTDVPLSPSVVEIDPFEAAWKAYPHRKGRSSRPKALKAWKALPSEYQNRMLSAAKRYAAEGFEPKADCGAMAFEGWLNDHRFLDWMVVETAAPTLRWTGPPDLRVVVSNKFGDAYAASWLDPCAWQDVPERMILAPTGICADRLWKDFRAELTEREISIGRKVAA